MCIPPSAAQAASKSATGIGHGGHFALAMSVSARWVRRLVALGLLWPEGSAATCASGSTTLTTESCSGCGDYDLCLGFASASSCSGSNCETSGACTYECLSVDKSSEELVVLVEFGTYRSDQELAAGGYSTADLAGYPDETSKWPSVSNNQVTALGKITVSSAVTTFVLDSNYITTVDSVAGVDSITTLDQANFLNGLETLGLSATDFSEDVNCGDAKESVIFDVAVCITDDGALTTKSPSASTASNDVSSASSEGSTTSTTSTSSSSSSTSLIVGVICGVFVVLFAAFLFVIHRRKQEKRVECSIASDTVGYSSDHFSSTGNWNDRLQQLPRGRRTSEFDFARHPSDVSMGIPTLTHEEGDESPEAVVPIATAVSSIPSFVSTEEAGSKGKPQRFMSIWNDLELLSLQLRASAIKDVKQLGSGAYATVWLVRYRNLQLLASKRLRPERRTKKHTAAFVEEIKLIANFDHPNLVRLIGAAWTVETDLQMLLEYMEGGDLRKYLAEPSTPSGWTTTKFNIAIDIIEALVYLHSFVPPLVHRDLKSKNVLLSADCEAKLSDFGTSRFRSSDKTMTGGVGTGRWLAPEVIRGDSDYGTAVDIYSFGTLLTELDTNQIPYDNVRASNGKIMSDLTILHRVATGKLHPKVRDTCGKALRDLVERCLLDDPSKRPTAPAIAYELRVIQPHLLFEY
ncbi:unnamed protein product [Phytophthora lilii]|uniref:Unnamed protein product n=1 Tax=Phytophthora lilii TaxID=2077276 RepID=A0A9W6TC03_9STRA|nr:unnamed protein product [Phytophthora lilii]